MQLTDFKALTFDCYGTLIDWETGILQALQPWLQQHSGGFSEETILAVFAEHESAQQAQTPAMLYPQLLAEVMKRMGRNWNLPVSDEQAAAFGHSVPDWPAFADSAAALAYLKQHYKLVILSNVDRTSFKASNAKLGVEFDAIYTAQDVGSYKPDPANFAYMLEHIGALGIQKSDILHTAQSLFHDHVQAKKAGLATCWIDRRMDKGGLGATGAPPEQVEVDFHYPSMAALAEAHRALLS
jgi:2-haloalkanoic acid dehalogenase type II